MYISSNYVRLTGLQIKAPARDYRGAIIAAGGCSYLRISYNIIKSVDTSSYTWRNGIQIGASSSGPSYIWNNIIYDFLGTGNYAIYMGHDSNRSGLIANNTVINCYTGIYGDSYGGVDLKNNLVKGCAVPFSSTGNWKTAYNNACDNVDSGIAADDEQNTHESHTFTFVGAADFHLASNDAGALGYGLNLYNDAALAFQDDIDGQDRGGAGAPWDIGADEYVAAGIKIPVAIHHYQQAGGL
jgi:hypothetical protein